MKREGYETVLAYLESQRRNRPQSLKEIAAFVSKSEWNCVKEINGLVLRGMVRIVVVRFNKRECPFYTLREDVSSIEVVHH